MLPLEMCQQKTDAELVFLTKKNEKYLACLINRYEQRLLTYIKRLSSFNQDEAEDVLQETFIKIFYNLEDFDEKLKFSSWLYRIAHNETINAFRKKKTKIFINLTPEEWGLMANKIDLDQSVWQKIDQEKMHALINKLESKYQDVLILKFLEGYEYQDISDILQKPIGTVATLINRAKKKLKQELIKNNYYD